jgi:predicted HTH domain antitoxin
MSITIEDDVLEAAGVSADEFRLEVAVLLFQRGLTVIQASQTAGKPLDEFMQELARRNMLVPSSAHESADDRGRNAEPGSNDEAEPLRRAIRHAIEIADAKNARILIAEGRARFPEDEWIVRAERVMAVPEAHYVEREPVSDPRADWRWLDEHAREYRGQWVALKDGGLVAAAPSLSALAAAVPDVRDVFVTQVF